MRHQLLSWLAGLVIVVVALMSMGCGPDPHIDPHDQAWQQGLTEVRLSDGTRCVRLFQNALDCDWDHKPTSIKEELKR